MHSRARGRLPAARHGGELRQRARGRRGDPDLRRTPRRDHRGHQAARPPPRRTTTRSPASSGSLERMGLDRIDLHLIHWPNPRVGQVRRGLAGAGRPARAGAGPLDRRLQLHRGAPRADHRRDRRDAGRQPDRAAPLLPAGARCARSTSDSASAPSRGARSASGRRRSPSRRWPSAAEKYGVTPGQVILRWQVQLGSVPIPKSATPERQRQNLDVFGFELTDGRGGRDHRRSAGPTGGSSAATPTPTRRCSGLTRPGRRRPCRERVPHRHGRARPGPRRG